MKSFEVLCTTMHQTGLDLFQKMKLSSDVVFANQTDKNTVEVTEIQGHRVTMISTDTRGVGLNRNISFLAATADICLFADDDIVYRENYAQDIVNEFERHPTADIIIFNIGCSTPEFGRIPTIIKKFKRFGKYSKNPYGAPRIAFRLSSVKKTNIVFSRFFGGGAIYPSGEDTIWLRSMLNVGLKIFLSPVFIGDISYEASSWFDMQLEKKLFGYGAMLRAQKIKLWVLYMMRYVLRSSKKLGFLKSCKLVSAGYHGYDTLTSFDEYLREKEKTKCKK